MATTEERLAALEAKLAALTATTPTEYYTHQYSGEEIDAAVGRALTGGALDTSVTNVSNQLGTFVRPNLLDNWYFRRPVNQRGKTEYTGSTYSVDRWFSPNNCSLVDGGLLITASPGEVFTQRFTQEMQTALSGKTVTFSVLATIKSGVFYLTDTNGFSASHADVKMQTGVTSWTFSVANFNSISGLGWWSNGSGTQILVHAAKLELGPTQTLAHQENGMWVLNEVPEYGEQLRRCLRYCRVDDFTDSYTVAAFGVAASETYWRGLLPSYSDMRTKPTIAIIGDNPSVQLIGNGQSINIAGLVPTVISAKTTGTAIGFNGVSGLVANQTYALQLYRCKIIRSADL